MNRRIGKLLWRSIGILLAVVVLFQTAFLLYFRDFYGSAEKEFWVPGLSGEFVPQGMDRLREGFLLSGYLCRQRCRPDCIWWRRTAAPASFACGRRRDIRWSVMPGE